MEASHIEKNRIKYVDILKSEHEQTKKTQLETHCSDRQLYALRREGF